MDQAKLELDKMKTESNADIQEMRIRSEDKRAGAQIGAKLAADLDKSQRSERLAGAKLGLEIAKDLNLDDRELARAVERNNGRK